MRRQVDNHLCNCIDGTADAEQKFCSGLATIRKARVQALTLVAD